MTNYFDEALKFVLQAEGGFSNTAGDLGGATNLGVTQAVYNTYRASHGLPAQSVALILNNEVSDIYHNEYWIAAKCDQITNKVSVIHFNTAVNTGCHEASLLLQRSAGVAVDGIIGSKTLNAVNNNDPNVLSGKYIQELSNFYTTLAENHPNDEGFLTGWLNRTAKLNQLVAGLA